MPELALIATTIAHPEHYDEVRAAMARLVEPSRAEPGCLEYVMHRSLTRPNALVFFERWKSKEHLEAHTRTTHFLECMEALAGLTEETILEELVRIE